MPYETRDVNQTGKSHCAFVENIIGILIMRRVVLETRVSKTIVIIIRLMSYCDYDKCCHRFLVVSSGVLHCRIIWLKLRIAFSLFILFAELLFIFKRE